MTNNEQLIEIIGEVEDIIFRNESNGYSVSAVMNL